MGLSWEALYPLLYPRSVVPNLGPPDVLGLQLPEAFTTTSAGQDFLEWKSKNIWKPKVRDHWSRWWLKSRKGFLHTSQELNSEAEEARLKLWRTKSTDLFQMHGIQTGSQVAQQMLGETSQRDLKGRPYTSVHVSSTDKDNAWIL